MKVMMIIAYCPGWLAYNGTGKGVPMDLDVYADIVRKVYSRYHKYIDWVEVYNEPGYFMTIDKSPYASAGAALADIYMTCGKGGTGNYAGYADGRNLCCHSFRRRSRW